MNKYETSSYIKAKILESGFTIHKDVLRGLGTEYKEEHRGYDNSNWGVTDDIPLPAEIMLPGNIIAATHIRQNTLNSIQMVDDKLCFFIGEENISEVKFLKRPKIWSKKLRDGTDIKKILNIYGLDILNFNLFAGCEFWDKGVPCKFCSVKPTQERFKEAIIRKDINQISEAASVAFSSGDKISYILTTGGSYVDPDKEFNAHIKALLAIKERSRWKNIMPGNTALMPPLKSERLKTLYDTGIKNPSFNLEVWGKKKFREICPGKDRFRGYQNILNAYRHCVKEYYGEGRMWCNFVAGLNTLEELKSGFRYMAAAGVVPGANVFHPDVGAVYGGLSSPPFDYIVETYHYASDIYHELGFKPFFKESSLRNSLANEAYKGWI